MRIEIPGIALTRGENEVTCNALLASLFQGIGWPKSPASQAFGRMVAAAVTSNALLVGVVPSRIEAPHLMVWPFLLISDVTFLMYNSFGEFHGRSFGR